VEHVSDARARDVIVKACTKKNDRSEPKLSKISVSSVQLRLRTVLSNTLEVHFAKFTTQVQFGFGSFLSFSSRH